LHEPRYYKSKSAENTAEFLTFFTWKQIPKQWEYNSEILYKG
jgi:hypothetical protein